MRKTRRDLVLERLILKAAETEKNAVKIAAVILCTPDHVRRTLKRHNLYVKAPRPPALKRKQVLELARLHEAWSCEKIAEVVRCSESYARKVMIDEDINTVRCRKFYRRWADWELEQVQDLIICGLSKPEVASLLDLPEQRVIDAGSRYSLGAHLRSAGNRDRALEMLSGGMELKEVAKVLGLHRDTIKKYHKNMSKQESKCQDIKEHMK